MGAQASLVLEYARWELWPVYTSVIVVWVLTTPIRSVRWVFLTQVWCVLSMNLEICGECASSYRHTLQDREFRQLRGSVYDFAAWSVFFNAPTWVLQDGDARYGAYGRIFRSWWIACKVSFAEYLPNVLVDTKDSGKRYWNASWEASRATLLRFYGVGEFVCWVALLCLSLLLFVPINLYDLVEFVLQGPIGVAIGLMLLVTYDYCYEWTRWDLLGPLIVVVTGVILHALRLCEEDNPLLSWLPECGVPRLSAWNACGTRTVSKCYTTFKRRKKMFLLRKRSWVTPMEPSNRRTILSTLRVRQKQWLACAASIGHPFAEDGKLQVGEYVPYPGM
ncbi:hypothetical protein PInf_023324 [Phytophthora infestans]|nr:hypothetical protein PInf_023324 [Phytophthora infestans]